MNELENPRKRAKLLVRQHRAGLYTVAARLRQSLPRFAGMTDREVLAAKFALHDAQEIIASELGFSSWSELKESPPVSVTDTSAHRLQRATAQLFVTDFARAMTFYRVLLGFEIVFTYGEPPFYGEVRRDDAGFNVRHVDESPFVADAREQEQLLSASIVTTGAKSLFLEFEAAGSTFRNGCRRSPGERLSSLSATRTATSSSSGRRRLVPDDTRSRRFADDSRAAPTHKTLRRNSTRLSYGPEQPDKSQFENRNSTTSPSCMT
ncbi:hypothetical protein L2X99_08975 [Microbacterium sp. KUDC0406]|uniref:hypothetical protein n=1 Tax=Microbacterium sp. KUDC0406 TaxID=2909588 RepID=UPI001F2C2B68|nr:hypothetical protein [Microbacterium sp. KUDC0406]UJP11590.1 hypothetical protein L2X99_08975 [Microbacterium sp. KUDC0406]